MSTRHAIRVSDSITIITFSITIIFWQNVRIFRLIRLFRLLKKLQRKCPKNSFITYVRSSKSFFMILKQTYNFPRKHHFQDAYIIFCNFIPYFIFFCSKIINQSYFHELELQTVYKWQSFQPFANAIATVFAEILWNWKLKTLYLRN